ncbi:MAG: hypothetical protein P8I38_07650 [Arenicella sp.]|jgi:hypothetical protein|nr:hypothetical protein [Arenicella sp.]
MNNLNWSKWASIAEILSSIVILVTLFYLAIQTQQNTNAINSQSRQSLAESAVFEQTIWMQYPQLSSFIVDSSLDMSFEDKVQLDSLMLLSMSRREFAFRQYQAGVLNESVWRQEVAVIALLIGTERTRSWWNAVGKSGFETEFSNAVDAIIEGQPLHPYWIAMQNWQTETAE